MTCYTKRHVTVTFSLTDKNRCTSKFLTAKYSKAKIHFMKYKKKQKFNQHLWEWEAVLVGHK